MLAGAADISVATQSVGVDSLFPSRSTGRTLDVLVAGAVLPPNPGAMIESRAMDAVLEQAKSTYDLVVIDTPPLTAVSDAFPLLGKVDGVVIVGWVGRNHRDVAQRLHETLGGAGAPLLGVIANGFKPGRLDSYGYGYGYAQDEHAAAAGGSPYGVDAPYDVGSAEDMASTMASAEDMAFAGDGGAVCRRGTGAVELSADAGSCGGPPRCQRRARGAWLLRPARPACPGEAELRASSLNAHRPPATLLRKSGRRQ